MLHDILAMYRSPSLSCFYLLYRLPQERKEEENHPRKRKFNNSFHCACAPVQNLVIPAMCTRRACAVREPCVVRGGSDWKGVMNSESDFGSGMCYI